MKNRNLKSFVAFQLTTRTAIMALAVVLGAWPVFFCTLLMPIIGLSGAPLSVIDKDLQAAIDQIASENKAALKTVKEELMAKFTGLIDSTELTKSLEKLGLKEETVGKLNTALEKQGLELQKLKDNPSNEEGSLEKFLATKKSEVNSIATASGKTSIKLELPKAVQKTLVQRSAVSGNTMAYRVPGIGQLRGLTTAIEDSLRHVQVGPDSNGAIRYIDQVTVTNNAAWTAEAAQKPESVIAWQEYLLPIEKIADSIPVTKEAFKDLSFVEGELNRLLEVNIANKVDDGLMNGTGVTPIIRGLKYYAPTYTPASPYLSVPSANIFDLISAVASYIANLKDGKYSPDVVYLNPADLWRYKILKASDGTYILPPFTSDDGMQIDSLRVIASTRVAQNTLVVGDSRYAVIYELEGLNVEMGWINDQFIKNQFTILAERRLQLLVRTADLDAFAEVNSISAALTAMAPA